MYRLPEYLSVPKWLQCPRVHSMLKHLNFWFSIVYGSSKCKHWLEQLVMNSVRGIFSDYCSLSLLAKTYRYCPSMQLEVQRSKRRLSPKPSSLLNRPRTSSDRQVWNPGILTIYDNKKNLEKMAQRDLSCITSLSYEALVSYVVIQLFFFFLFW